MTLRTSAYAAFVVLFLGIIPGEMFKLYDRVPYFDKQLHFLGGFVIAAVVFAFFRNQRATMSPLAFGLLIISTATLVGVLWEHAEYLSGSFTKDYFPLIYRYFHGGGLADTLADLAFDILGAATFVAIKPRKN